MTRRPLDRELVRRGLAATPAEAQELVDAGRVLVAGRPALSPGRLVLADEPVVVEPPTGYVSRGATKLEAALDRFAIDPRDARCLDAGAATGGFTDVLLTRGAAHVVAVDVGYGQLAWRLRRDPRVTVLERFNVRRLSPADLPYRPDLVVADLSFISLSAALPALVGSARQGAELVLLVKPQFEADPHDVGAGGVVRDPTVWAAALDRVAASAARTGAPALAAMPSPIRGPAGNVEFLLHARVGAPPADLDLGRVVAEGVPV